APVRFAGLPDESGVPTGIAARLSGGGRILPFVYLPRPKPFPGTNAVSMLAACAPSPRPSG
ncbi:MAG: hypothetical protein NT154_17105, partial [Verrucomicrobia bacterium]|nr:hypothetical protein [Verrucomicrobiota bacterium]